MGLVDYFAVLRRRFTLVLLAVVLGAGAAAAASLVQQPRYTASTQVIVAGGANESSVDEMVRRQLAAERASAYSMLLGTAPAVGMVTEAVGVPASNPVVTAFADGTQPFITIVVTADRAADAQKIANGYPTLIGRIVTELEQTPTARPPVITPLTRAGLPTAPTSPRPLRDIPVGAAVGLVLGLLAAFLRESMDLRVRESSEIEKVTGETLLGAVPKEFKGEALPSLTHPRSGRAEAYRHLRANLEFTTADGMPRSVAVTSPAPGEGKSTLAANLAVAAARAGYNVVLVDADLRKPTVAKLFSLSGRIGLSSVLLGQADWRRVLQPVPGERLHLLTSGELPPSPSELVASTAMTALVEDLERHFDLVVIDTPPLLPVSDGLVIGVNVGGVVVVARMGVTRRQALRRAVESLRKADARLMGVVANAVVKKEEKAYGEGYGYAYGYLTPEAHTPAAPAATLQPAGRRQGVGASSGRHARRGKTEVAEVAEVPVPAAVPTPDTMINLRAAEPPVTWHLPDPRTSQSIPSGRPVSSGHPGHAGQSAARSRLDDFFPRS